MREMRLADGRRFAWREAGQGRPLVLLHGWAMSSAVFAEALADLGRDFRVLAPDLRGHGQSDGSQGYALADFAADLDVWLKALDLSGVVLAGWSLGGEVALELLPALRDRAAGLLLLSTTPRFTAGDGWQAGLPNGQVHAMARSLKGNYQKAMGEFFALQFVDGEVSPERYRSIVAFAVQAGRLPAPEVALAALATLRTADLRPKLAALDLPALVMHGELDPIIPAGAGRFLAENLPRGRLTLIPGAGHAPFLSRPRESFRAWREFIHGTACD